jgi:F-type H+-transporting ATPase subunit epsilon
MNLEILLPFGVFAKVTGVSEIAVDTSAGSLGLLPHRLDCAAALVPGILSYAESGNATVYVAVDEGVMVKTGDNVLVSVRHAIGGTDLSRLHESVKSEFLKIGEQERDVRAAVSRMEGGLMRRLAEFEHGH